MIAHPHSLVPLVTAAAATLEARRAVAPGSNDERFTIDGPPELEQHLARTCAKIAAGIRGLVPARKLQAVLLGGGYGRGEGGVLQVPAGAQPYNDLEFYVFIRGNRHVAEATYGRALHVLGEILTPQAGAEVEFKIASLRELQRRPVSMFSYDLMLGHRWLMGDERLLSGCSHHRDAARIPLSEATRLLMNRCSGLLFAAERLQRRDFTPADADFVARNLAKAELALGDALLVTRGEYHWSVRERARRVQDFHSSDPLFWLEDVRRRHVTGMEFKLHPQRSSCSQEALAAKHRAVTALAGEVWLWLEQQRMCAPFASARDYALSELQKCRETSPVRNALINLRTFGARAWREPQPARHPRERILNVMTLLLWDPATLGSPALLRFVQRELRTSAADFAGLLRAYRELWAKVN